VWARKSEAAQRALEAAADAERGRASTERSAAEA
jgi:hypothetical protein